MKNVRVKYLLLVAAVVFQVFWYAFAMVSFFNLPDQLEGADFRTYYAAGKIANIYGFNSVYNMEKQGIAQAEVMGLPGGSAGILPANHPPFLFPLLAALAPLPYRQAYLGYAASMLMVGVAGCVVLSTGLRRIGWPLGKVLVLCIGILLFEPFFISILKGQDSALLMLGGLLFLTGMLLDKSWLAGLGLSLTLIRPQVAIVLAVPFFFRQIRVFQWFLIGGAILGVYSFALVGPIGTQDFIKTLTLSAQGHGYGMAESAMFSIGGMLLRIFPNSDINVIHFIVWACFGVAIIILCFLWWRARKIEAWHISLAVCLSLLVAPHLHYHDLTLLVVPLTVLGITGVSNKHWAPWIAASIPIVLSILLLFSEFWDPARLSVPYLAMVLIPFFTKKYGSS